MAKNAIAKLWNLLLRSDGTRYSKPPIVPPTLAAEANSTTQITVTATGASSGLGSITGYLWYRNGVLLSATPSATPLVDTGLTPGTLYAYAAIAVDSATNRSAMSAQASVATNASSDTTAPTVPSGVTASTLSSSSIRVVWLPSTDAVGVTGYTVERSADGATGWVIVGSPATPTFDDAGLPANTRQYYRVKARDAASNISASSVVVSAVTLTSGSGAGTFFVDEYASLAQRYLDLDNGSDANDGLTWATAKRTWEAGVNLLNAKGMRLQVRGRSGAPLAGTLPLPAAIGGTGPRVISGEVSATPGQLPVMNFGNVLGRSWRPNAAAHCDDLVIRKLELTGLNQSGAIVFDYDYTYRNLKVENILFPRILRFDGDNCAHLHLHGAASNVGGIPNTGVQILTSYFPSITGSAGANLCNIQVYQTPGGIIRGNNFNGRSLDGASRTGAAVFLKKGPPQGTVAGGWLVVDNDIRHYERAFYQSISGAGEDAQHNAHTYRSNVIDYVNYVFTDNASEAAGISRDHSFIQNTLGLNTEYGLGVIGVLGLNGHSNIFLSTTRRLTLQNAAGPPARNCTVSLFDNNVHYVAQGNVWVFDQYGGTQQSFTSLPAVRAAYPGRSELLADIEENSISLSALTDFVNAAGGNYALQAGSALRTAGRGGIRMGYDETSNGPGW